jgi:hypothetical protein
MPRKHTPEFWRWCGGGSSNNEILDYLRGRPAQHPPSVGSEELDLLPNSFAEDRYLPLPGRYCFNRFDQRDPFRMAEPPLHYFPEVRKDSNEGEGETE